MARWQLSESLSLSPQQVDPLSWFTRPFLPVTFAIAIALCGVGFVLGTLEENSSPILQLLGVLCFVLACLSIHRKPGPRLAPFRPWHASVPLVLSWLGVVVSGAGATLGNGEVSRWWAPIGVAVVLAALAPFCSAAMLVRFGLLGTAVCSTVAVIAFGVAPDGDWPLATTLMIGALAPLQATVATAYFSAFVVDRVRRWSNLPIQGSLGSNPALDFSRWNAQRGELKLLSDRVIPFIEQVADDGFVSLRDRTVAAELAREIRDALLQSVDQSWLDKIAADHHLRVIDPDNLAGRLGLTQRGAVRSLLMAVLDSPALEQDTLAIELRAGADRSVAVGLTMRLDLPEGKRLMMLAPYYLTLQATVDDLVWDDRDQNLRFRVPGTLDDPD